MTDPTVVKTFDFIENLKEFGTQAAVNAGVQIALAGEQPLGAMKQALVGGIVSLGASLLSFEAGVLKDKGMHSLTHKLMHGAIGGLTAAALGKDIGAGAIGQAVGAAVAEKWLAYKREMNPGDLTEEASQRFREEALALAKLAAGFGAYVVGRAPEDAACMVDAALSYDIFVKDQAMVQEYERKEAAKVEAKAKKSAEVQAFLEQRRLENEEKERVRAARNAEIAAQKQKTREAHEKLAAEERARQEKHREKKAKPFQARPVEEPNLEDLVRQHYGVKRPEFVQDQAKAGVAEHHGKEEGIFSHMLRVEKEVVEELANQFAPHFQNENVKMFMDGFNFVRRAFFPNQPRIEEIAYAYYELCQGLHKLDERMQKGPRPSPQALAQIKENQELFLRHGGLLTAPSPEAGEAMVKGVWKLAEPVVDVIHSKVMEPVGRGFDLLAHNFGALVRLQMLGQGYNDQDAQFIAQQMREVGRIGLDGVPIERVFKAFKLIKNFQRVEQRVGILNPFVPRELHMQYQLKAPVNRGLEGLALERRGFPQGNKLFNAPKGELKGPNMPKGEGLHKGPVLHPVEPLPIKAPKAEVPFVKKDPVVRPPEAHKRPDGRGVLPPEAKYNVPPELLRLQRDRLAPLNLERPHMRNLGKKGIGDGGPHPGLKKAPKDLEAKKPIALKNGDMHAPNLPKGTLPPGQIYKASYVLDEVAFAELQRLAQGVVVDIERGVFAPSHILMKDRVLHYPISWATDVKGIRTQGMMFEDVAASMLPPALRLRAGFKVFDFYDHTSGLAISLKTLNTNAVTYNKSPSQIYSKLKEYVDKTLSFDKGRNGLEIIRADMINVRRIEIGIPETVSEAQWRHIERAMDYAREKGVEFNVIKIKVA